MTSPGQIARKVLGPAFNPVGNAWRRIFVNLDRIADVLAGEVPQGGRILDIGGGDGALIDRLLKRRNDISVTLCDVAPTIGAFLSAANRDRVHLLPATDFNAVDGRFDVVTITDVMHHVPVDEREPFFASLASSCERWGCRRILFKDVEPGSIRSHLSLLADWYITGDRHVVLFSRSAFGAMAQRHFPNAKRKSQMPDSPNYCEILTW